MKLQVPVQSSGLWSQTVIWWYFEGPRHDRYRRRRPTKRTNIKVTGLFQHTLLFGQGTRGDIVCGFLLC